MIDPKYKQWRIRNKLEMYRQLIEDNKERIKELQAECKHPNTQEIPRCINRQCTDCEALVE